MPLGATESQVRIAQALGLDISSDTQSVAAARIRDVVAEAIGERYGSRPATEKQIKFAESLGLAVRTDSLRVVAAKLGDELERRNQDAMSRLALKPGDRVRIPKVHDLNGQRYEWTDEYTVSSIDERGRLYFKGGGGAGAWASQVEKLEGS